jgi:hypothetical protein
VLLYPSIPNPESTKDTANFKAYTRKAGDTSVLQQWLYHPESEVSRKDSVPKIYSRQTGAL